MTVLRSSSSCSPRARASNPASEGRACSSRTMRCEPSIEVSSTWARARSRTLIILPEVSTPVFTTANSLVSAAVITSFCCFSLSWVATSTASLIALASPVKPCTSCKRLPNMYTATSKPFLGSMAMTLLAISAALCAAAPVMGSKTRLSRYPLADSPETRCRLFSLTGVPLSAIERSPGLRSRIDRCCLSCTTRSMDTSSTSRRTVAALFLAPASAVGEAAA